MHGAFPKKAKGVHDLAETQRSLWDIRGCPLTHPLCYCLAFLYYLWSVFGPRYLGDSWVQFGPFFLSSP